MLLRLEQSFVVNDLSDGPAVSVASVISSGTVSSYAVGSSVLAVSSSPASESLLISQDAQTLMSVYRCVMYVLINPRIEYFKALT